MSLARWLFGMALRAFPPRAHNGLEDEAVCAFSSAYAARRRQGWWSALRYLVLAVFDAACAGLRERRDSRRRRRSALDDAGTLTWARHRAGTSTEAPRRMTGSHLIADMRQAARLYIRLMSRRTCRRHVSRTSHPGSSKRSVSGWSRAARSTTWIATARHSSSS